MSKPFLSFAVASVLAVALVGCDTCANLPADRLQACCLDDPDAPSCARDKPVAGGCGEEARDVSSACRVTVGTPMRFSVSSASASLQDRFFAVRTCADCRSLAMSLVPVVGASSSVPGRFRVQVFNAGSEVVAVYYPQGAAESASATHAFGVTPDSDYYLRVHAESGGATDLQLTVTAALDTYEVEPNDAMDETTPLASGGICLGDHAGIDPSRPDTDFFSFVNDGTSGSLIVQARRLEPIDLDRAVAVAVFDERAYPTVPERRLADFPFAVEIGVAALSRYFVRVTTAGGEPRQRYELTVSRTGAAVEMEPNDIANAEELVSGNEVRGGYSVATASDDDVFRLVVPEGTTQARVSVHIAAPDAGLGGLDVTVLDAAETQLGAQAIGVDGPFAFTVPIRREELILVRVRSSSNFIDHQYTLNVELE